MTFSINPQISAVGKLNTFFWFHVTTALLYGAIGVSQYPSALDIKSPPMITACPAANAQGMKFNEEVSISGESLFVKNVCKKQAALDNLKVNVCRNPIKPVTFYDLGKKIYEIGYEVGICTMNHFGF